MIMEKYITKNGIKYELRGEQYYPMFDLGEQTTYEIGKYGHLHLEFIKKHRRGTYTTLLTEGRLNMRSVCVSFPDRFEFAFGKHRLAFFKLAVTYSKAGRSGQFAPHHLAKTTKAYL